MKNANTIKTMFFLTLLTLLFVFIGQMIGQAGALIALILAALMNFVSYWFSDKIVLKMYCAHEVGYNDHPELYNTVNRLCQYSSRMVVQI